MKITIIIEDNGQGLTVRGLELPGGQSAVEASNPTPQAQGPISSDPGASGSDPPASPDKLAKAAKTQLAELGVEKIDNLLRSYKPERLIEVCQAAVRKGKQLKKPAGYVIRALRQGWAV